MEEPWESEIDVDEMILKSLSEPLPPPCNEPWFNWDNILDIYWDVKMKKCDWCSTSSERDYHYAIELFVLFEQNKELYYREYNTL